MPMEGAAGERGGWACGSRGCGVGGRLAGALGRRHVSLRACNREGGAWRFRLGWGRSRPALCISLEQFFEAGLAGSGGRVGGVLLGWRVGGEPGLLILFKDEAHTILFSLVSCLLH
jgi:hypothetical protein